MSIYTQAGVVFEQLYNAHFADCVKFVDLFPVGDVQNNYLFEMACETGFMDLVELLVSRSVNVSYLDNTPIKRAAWYGHIDLVIYLFENGVIKDQSLIDELMKCAVLNGKFEMIRYLKDQGANIDLAKTFFNDSIVKNKAEFKKIY